MRYLFLTTAKAEDYGFPKRTHLSVGGMTVLNEKEVMNSPAVKGSLEERAETLEAEVMDLHEIKNRIMNYSKQESNGNV